MKTNHRRNFVAKKHKDSKGFGIGTRGQLSQRIVGTRVGYEFTNGHRGMAKARRAAKKFVRTRIRFHENAATRKIARKDE